MRKDILITANSKTSMVNLPQSRLGINGENLQGNLILKFEDEFIDGVAIIEIKRGNEKYYLSMTKDEDKYVLPILSSLLSVAGIINMEIRITEAGNNIPVWKSNIFFLKVEEAINATTTIPEEYPTWIDTANAKILEIDEAINEVDNLNIDVNKSGTTTTVEITKKDGTTESVQILDGQNGENGQDGQDGRDGIDGQNGADGITPTIGDNGNWYLGDTDTGKPSRGIQGETGATGDKGDKGDTGEKGDKGDTGANGQNGYTPVKGVDYFTEQDISDIETDVISVVKNANDLTYYYTKNEVDGKISSVYKYKGTVATYNDLPSNNLTVGDVYNVETDGSNYAWTGTTWDKLGGDIDLSGYQTKIDSTHKLSSDLVDDENSTNKFVSSQEKNTWNNKGTYSKPANGIPKTDLASGVQTSLDKADTALQSYTEQYTGTITGITMNGVSKGTSGVVDLGTVITSHQDISGKLDTSKVKSSNSTTAGDVYDVTYINSMIGNIEVLLGGI